MRAIVALLIGLTLPAGVLAQPSTADAPPRPSWDATGIVSFLAARPDLDVNDRYYDNWYETAQAGLIVGRHVTSHLKLDVEAATSLEARQYVLRLVTVRVPGRADLQQFPVSTERYAKLHQVSALVTWQFLDNEWVHPFVQFGGGADIERVRWNSVPHVIYLNDPRLPGSTAVVTAPPANRESRTLGRLLAGGGAKFYLTPRAFFRTDARFGVGDRGGHVVLRIGFGADF